jgi:uncharacterized protein (TIGR00369 family)
MPGEEHFRKLERMYVAAATNRYYDPTLVVRDGEAEVTIDVDPKYFHAAGAVHGSVYFKLLDDAAWFAVNSLIEDVCVLTSSFNLHLFRPVTRGLMKASGRVVHRSSRIFVAEAVLEDGNGLQLARGGGSFMRTSIPLTPEIGYV